MDIDEHQQWLVNFYKQRNWYDYSPFIHLNFLTEEVGELARVVRAIEIGRDHPGETHQTPAALDANLNEELADVMEQGLMVASPYNIDPQELLQASQNKLTARFHTEN